MTTKSSTRRRAIFTQDIAAFCIQSRRRRPPRSKPKTIFLRPKSSFASKKGRKWTHFFLSKYVHLRPSTNATQEFDDANPIHIHVISDQSDKIDIYPIKMIWMNALLQVPLEQGETSRLLDKKTADKWLVALVAFSQHQITTNKSQKDHDSGI